MRFVLGGDTMGGYFLKTHYKTIGTYPDKAVHFQGEYRELALEFSRCRQFLLYETKKGDRPRLQGAGTLWGLGIPLGQVLEIPAQQVDGRQFTLAVPVKITRYLRERNRGVPGQRIQEILGRPLGFAGGVFPLSPEKFNLLLEELEGRLAREGEEEPMLELIERLL